MEIFINFSTGKSICVKCAGKCTMYQRLNVTPKCALCQHKGHTANYKYDLSVKSAFNRIRERNYETTATINSSNSGQSYAVTKKNYAMNPRIYENNKIPSCHPEKYRNCS